MNLGSRNKAEQTVKHVTLLYFIYNTAASIYCLAKNSLLF